MIKVLDRGYIELIDYWGSDERIIESARMSTNKGFQGWDTDTKLLKFLYVNKHMTPFEMCGLTIEVQAPIFVFREWHRHRTQSYNELSARYTPIPDLNYLPTNERCFGDKTTKNKQAQSYSMNELSISDVDTWLIELEKTYQIIEETYQKGLQLGIPKEIARLPVAVGRYSKMRASANLRNWLGFLTLRMAPNAQFEIREYANALYIIIKEQFPKTAELFKENQ